MSSVPPPNWQPSMTPAPEGPARIAPARGVRRRPLAAAALAALALIAGVLVLILGPTSTKLTDPIAQAATVSSNAAGYRMHMSLDLPSLPGVPTATGVGNGSVDVPDHLATMSMVLSFGGNQAAKTLTMDEILDRSTIYLKLPAVAMPALGAAGKPWVKFDLGTISHLPGLSSLGGNPATTDPSQVLRSLRSASSDVTTEGEQEVDGAKTTLYHADLNLDELAKSLPSADQAIARGALEQGLGAHTLPIEVWIDAGHLVRRLRMALDATAPGGQTVGVGMTVDFSDYGPQPRPAIPPTDQVQDIGTLAGS
jgi:hypothetical protein